MDEHAVVATRRSLHAVAERLLAGPQYREHGEIRLRVTPGGFGQFAGPLRVEGTEIVSADRRGAVARHASATSRPCWVSRPASPPTSTPSTPVRGGRRAGRRPGGGRAAARLVRPRGSGAAAVRAVREPVLWPEHFDLGIALGRGQLRRLARRRRPPEPYAYVGPWTPREGEFWNAPFGAVRTAEQLPDADAVAAFFAAGRAAAAG